MYCQDLPLAVLASSMAPLPTTFIVLLSFLVTAGHPLPLPDSLTNCFNSIFSFGDSITDTGNQLYSDRSNCSAGRLPYGETFFHHPTGRFSDGRLIIDFLAEALGMPHLPPYLPYSSKEFRWGANFAVGGATALDTDSFTQLGIPLYTPYSLNVQLSWFHQLLPSICPSQSDCQARLRKTLFMVGEIGGNDYGHGIKQGWSIHQVNGLVPKVIGVTESAITSLIEAGATTILVQGSLALGCLPSSLTRWWTKNKEGYNDRTGCVTESNELSEFHDRELVQMLERLRALHSHVSIVHADFYHSAMRVFESPHQFGITEPLKACCGAGGPYNYNIWQQCGDPGIIPCDNPESYLSWDGVHGTEALHRAVAQDWLQGPYNILPIFSNCPSYLLQLKNEVPFDQ